MSKATEQPQSLAAIDFLRTRSLTNVVQAEIERMIVDGELKPNERVNENGLATRLGISRGPIREACSALAAIGMIEVVPNRGFFVKALTNEEALDLSEARASIFGCMAMAAAELVTDKDIAGLEKLLDQMDALVDTRNVHDYYPINLQFHREIARLGGNNRLEAIYQSLVRELHIQRFRALSSPAVLRVSNAEHRAIVEALKTRNPVQALTTARSHIRNGIERTHKAGEPLR